MLFRLILAIFLAWTSILSAAEMTKEHEIWLKNQFRAQHEQLIPIVAVADMYFACHQSRNGDKPPQQVDKLITEMDKNELALRLSACLNGDAPNSDTALNFGLIGCFHEQLKELPPEDRKIKQKLVHQAIAKLSKSERQKSFTQCVTDQAIGYLK